MKLTWSNPDTASLRLATSVIYLFFIVWLTVCAVTGHAQQSSPSLTITSPSSGALVLTGQQVNVSVSSSAGSSFSSVQVLGENIGDSQIISSPPYTFSLAVPSGTIGSKKLTAVGITSSGMVVFSPSVAIDCEPSAALSSLSVSLSQINFTYSGDQVNLTVEGSFADSSQADVTYSSRTSYSSGNSSIAIVDANGLVTAVGPGTTTISATNGGQTAVANVLVPSSVRGDLNADGIVNTDDMNIILAALNTKATGPFDARDLDGDGVIDMKDVQALAALCTLPACATSVNTPSSPHIVLSPIAVTVGAQAVGSPSPAQTITVVNSGTAILTIQGTAISGDFAETSTCGGSLTPAASCAISIIFTPTSIGLRSGSLIITDNAAGSPHVLGLSGTGATPEVTLGQQNVAFAGQLVGTTSASQTLTVTNSGTADLNITGISLSGTNSSDFAITSGGTCPTSGGTLTAGASCSVNLTFTPGASGTRVGTLSIVDNASNSPQAVGLSGTGTVSVQTPTVQVTPSSSSITTAQPLTVTVAVNGGSGNATPTGSVTLTSGSYTSAATTLSSGSATINVPAGSLPTGADTLAASYSGDADYSATTGTASVTVTTAVSPSFTVSGTAVTISPGATTGNTSTITVTPAGGFTGSVALTAAITGNPTGAQYPPSLSFGSTSPVSITGTTAGTATLTISTTAATSSALAYPKRPVGQWYTAGGAALACILLFGIPARRRRWRTMLGMLALLVTLAGGVLACGGMGNGGGGGGTSNPGTTAGTYTVTVTGTSGSLTQTTTLTVTLN